MFSFRWSHFYWLSLVLAADTVLADDVRRRPESDQYTWRDVLTQFRHAARRGTKGNPPRPRPC